MPSIFDFIVVGGGSAGAAIASDSPRTPHAAWLWSRRASGHRKYR